MLCESAEQRKIADVEEKDREIVSANWCSQEER